MGKTNISNGPQKVVNIPGTNVKKHFQRLKEPPSYHYIRINIKLENAEIGEWIKEGCKRSRKGDILNTSQEIKFIFLWIASDK